MIDKAFMTEYELQFLKPAKTSRNEISRKTSFFIHLINEQGHKGIGECAPIFGLSMEDEGELRSKINEVIYLLNHGHDPTNLELSKFPSLSFALDCACKMIGSSGDMQVFENSFSLGQSSIAINGLVWIDSLGGMLDQLNQKIEDGFSCIKLKIGWNDFEAELELLEKIREDYGHKIELRLDANGAFDVKDALIKLEELSKYQIHSVEQPIMAGQWKEMAEIAKHSPIPIALDEELIGIEKTMVPKLLETIHPQFIIIKPSLVGNFSFCDYWVRSAETIGIDWWGTSALESNVGLSAIAQWVSTQNPKIPQGLGTGQIYSNNIPSPLELKGDELWYGNSAWNLEDIQWQA
ncbi:MAG: o-succinylbenzoate synthase [Vicingaceae bacterium]